MAFHAYLNFGGNCREAFTRYQEIFGGELVLLPMSDMPGAESTSGAGDLIMHAALKSGDRLLMASDDPSGEFDGVRGMYVSCSVPDSGEAKRVFEALAEGGQVTMPLSESFFSPAFGMCVDRFGTPWMVVTDAEQQPSS
jgi:PhnB protein